MGAAQGGYAAVIEELTTMPRESVRPHGDIRIALAVGLIASVLAFGLIGHQVSTPATARSVSPEAIGISSRTARMPDASAASPVTALLRISEPGDGALTAGPIVHVRAIASAALGTVRLAVKLGMIELGATTVEVAGPGAVAVAIPVIVPRFRVPVQLLIVAAPALRPVPLASANYMLQGGGSVEVWEATAAGEGGHHVVTVAGFAGTTVSSLAVEVRSSTGKLLARRLVTRGGGPAGARGSSLLLDRWVFRTPVLLADGASVPRKVDITWADPSEGTSGEMLTSVQVAEGSHSTGW